MHSADPHGIAEQAEACSVVAASVNSWPNRVATSQVEAAQAVSLGAVPTLPLAYG